MRSLTKMLFRDIAKTKGQFIAIALVVFSGIALFMITYTSYRNLVSSTEQYYNEYKFLDYYATAKNITQNQLDKIGSINGISAFEARSSIDISMNTKNNRKSVLRLITLPDLGMPEVNRLHLEAGTLPKNGNTNECLISEKFANFHKLMPGDRIKTTIGSSYQTLVVSGIANSPEFIWALQSSTKTLPSDEDFGIAYVRQSLLKKILGTNSSQNELHVLFDKNSLTNQATVIHNIEDILKPTGFLYGVERKNQLSYDVVDSEISEMEELAVLFPFLFLSVVAITIYMMLIKLITNQRGLIGTMKALGYTNSRILTHYTSYSLLIGIAGSIPGILVGYLLSGRMTSMYNDLFHIPVMSSRLYWDAIAISVGLSLLFCFTSGIIASRRILRIQPAQAMRTETPKAGHKISLERVTWLWKRLGFRQKMSIRNVFRNRQRTLLTILGMSVTIMLIVASLFFLNSIDYILSKQYKDFIAYDHKVSFSHVMNKNELDQFHNIKGITNADPTLEFVATALSSSGKSEKIMVTALEQSATSFRFINETRDPVKLKGNGIMLYSTLADRLSLKVGDTVIVTAFQKNGVKMVVSEILKQYTGFSAYMDYRELKQSFDLPMQFNSLLVNCNSSFTASVETALYKNPSVLSVEAVIKTRNSFKEMMKLFYEFIGGVIFFAFIMGFVIVFNTTFVNIMERKRELATLKVLGYKQQEIQSIVFRENLALGVLAIVPGLVLGRLVSGYLGTQFGTNMFSFDIIIYPQTYVIAIGSAFVFILLSQFAVAGSIKKLEIVDVLKNREE